jgi:hypothetical protein
MYSDTNFAIIRSGSIERDIQITQVAQASFAFEGVDTREFEFSWT